MTNFIFYPNEAYNKNKRITLLYPLMGSLLLILGALNVQQGMPLAGFMIALAGLIFIAISLIYSLSFFKYSSYYLIDDKIISFKKNIFLPAHEFQWNNIESINVEETHVLISLKDGHKQIFRPDMMGYHELQLFIQAIKENAIMNEIKLIYNK